MSGLICISIQMYKGINWCLVWPVTVSLHGMKTLTKGAPKPSETVPRPLSPYYYCCFCCCFFLYTHRGVVSVCLCPYRSPLRYARPTIASISRSRSMSPSRRMADLLIADDDPTDTVRPDFVVRKVSRVHSKHSSI